MIRTCISSRQIVRVDAGKPDGNLSEVVVSELIMYCSCAATIFSSTFDRNERLEMGCSWREFLCPGFFLVVL